MPIDRPAAETFIWSTARLLDRHRYAMLFADGSAEPVLAALAAYQNPDGGFGNGLEPDLRAPGSQPGPTLYALETLLEAEMLASEMGNSARAWVAGIAGPTAASPRRWRASRPTRMPRGGRPSRARCSRSGWPVCCTPAASRTTNG